MNTEDFEAVWTAVIGFVINDQDELNLFGTIFKCLINEESGKITE